MSATSSTVSSALPPEDAQLHCSAPGKVLAVGGYLVLERPHAALVVSATARFHTFLCPVPATSTPTSTPTSTSTAASAENPFELWIESPQFAASWRYAVDLLPNSLSLRPLLPSQSSNPYLERALVYSLLAVCGLRLSAAEQHSPKAMRSLLSAQESHTALRITVLGDNAFYSQADRLKAANLPRTRESLRSLPEFGTLTDAQSNLKKTGLGSSAALTTSLLGAICSFYSLIQLPRALASSSAASSSSCSSAVSSSASSSSFACASSSASSSTTSTTTTSTTTTSTLPTFSSSSASSSTTCVSSSSPVSPPSPMSLCIFHNLAQLTHCVAQGKIGSGFDVASAVYGTQRYVRFAKHLVDHALELCCALPSTVGPSPSQLLSLIGYEQSANQESCSNEDSESSTNDESESSTNEDVETTPTSVEVVCWNSEHEAFSLPSTVQMLLADVTGGSNTVALVRRVLAWRATPASATLWQQQGQLNLAAERSLAALLAVERQQQHCASCASRQTTETTSSPAPTSSAGTERTEGTEGIKEEEEEEEEDFATMAARLATLTYTQWKERLLESTSYSSASSITPSPSISTTTTTTTLECDHLHHLHPHHHLHHHQREVDLLRAVVEVRECFAAVRAGLRAISAASAVEIEPTGQTALLDATEALPGVLLCGVPGAGGYDAAFALLLHPNAAPAVERLWSSYAALHVLPLDVAENRESGGALIY